MKLLKIGEVPSEHPTNLTLKLKTPTDEIADVLLVEGFRDFAGHWFGSGVLERLDPAVAKRIMAGKVGPFGGRGVGTQIGRSHQIICVGLNHSDQEVESRMPVPDEPIVFTKSPNAIVGPNDDVMMGRRAPTLDWAVELGIVIGRRTSYLNNPEQAATSTNGCVLINDLSEGAS